MKKRRRMLALLLSAAMTAGLLSGCGQSGGESVAESQAGNTSETQTVDTLETVNLSLYLYGSEGVANQEILDELNKKLLETVNATLEIKYIDWGDVSTKYPLLWASGEEFDLAFAASSTPVPYATLAKQGAIVDITDMLDTYAPKLKEALPEYRWEGMKVDGRIYGVSDNYSEFTPYGFIYRRDLLEKYGMSGINSIDDMDAYMEAALEDGWIPLNGGVDLAMDLYMMLVDTTPGWIRECPGIQSGEPFLCSKSVDEPTEIFHPAFTQEYEDFVVRMREWADKGYWSKDVLSNTQDDKENCYNGLSASFITHMSDWTGNYGTQQQKLPGVETDFWCFALDNGKITRSAPSSCATVINAKSKYPERCLMVIEQLMTNEECYRLLQYGIEGRQYEIVDGMIVEPEGYDEEKDSGGFAAWGFRTDEMNIPSASEDPRRYILNEEWKEVAIDDIYAGFNFDSSNVTAELAAISNVNAQLGTQLLLGKTTQDPIEAVEEYRKQLTDAGIEKVIQEVKEQYEAFLNEN